MQIDFYILGDNSHRDINQMVCQLCEKATAQGLNVLVYTKSSEQAHQLDDLLWTFKAETFLTHKNDFNESENNKPFPYSITISSNITDESVALNYPMLINLSNESPAFHQHFKRIAEIIGTSPDDKETARSRYRFYRDKGYSLNKYDL